MDKWKVAKKIFKGALTGAMAAAVAIRPDDLQEGGQVVATAIAVGLINGAFNAWKHRNDGK